MYSERLAWVHWWLTVVGFLGFFTVLTAAGLTQAGSYAQGIPTVMVLPAVRSLWIGRAAFGLVIIVAQYIFAYNMLRTLLGTQRRELKLPRKLTWSATHRPRPRREGGTAVKMTPRLIVIGGLAVVLTVVAFVVFLPYVVFQPEDTLEATPYTPLEQEGRDLYVSNGCMYCHSQFTRPNDVTPSRVSKAGDFNYDKPHQLGTLRTGPDLANIGLKRGDRWELDHLKDPRELTPNSIMPSFSFLSDRQLSAIVAYLNRLGNHQTASTDLMIPAQVRAQEAAVQRDRRELEPGAADLRDTLPDLSRLRGQGRRARTR